MKDTYVSDSWPHPRRVPGHVACVRERVDRTKPPQRSNSARLSRNEAWTLRLARLSCGADAGAVRQLGALR